MTLPRNQVTFLCPATVPISDDANVLGFFSSFNGLFQPVMIEGVYTYDFKADNRFTPGKAYTYVISEQTTGGMVAGSGMVESMGITTIAGLAAAAPEAERAAKKALDAIKAVEAVVVSGENINIALTLQNLKHSVDALPETFAREGPSARVTQVVTEISDRIKKLAGDEGYDMATLLEKTLSSGLAVERRSGSLFVTQSSGVTSTSPLTVFLPSSRIGMRTL